MTYVVTVTATKGDEVVQDRGEGNTTRTAYAAAVSVKRHYEHDGYTVEMGRCQRVKS